MLRPANPHIICVAYCHIMRFAIYVTVSDVLVTTSIDLCVYRARFRCPGSPFRLFLSNRDRNTLEKIANSALPHNIRHHTSAEFRGFGITDNGRLQGGCPGSQKEAEITNRDSEICPGNRVNRLPSSPEHQLRIDRALQCSTGMRPYRDSDIPTEVWDSPRDQYYLPSFGASCLAWRITASGKPAWM